MHIQLFQERRTLLTEKIKKGVILLAANLPASRNYKANTYSFRQDSTFLYYTGLKLSGAYCILDCDSGKEYLAGNEGGIQEAIWTGLLPQLSELARQAAINHILSIDEVVDFIHNAQKTGRNIHYLFPYTGDRKIALADLLQIPVLDVDNHVSDELIEAVIEQRSVKTDTEIHEIEETLNHVTAPMHCKAIQMAREGIYEYEIVAEMQRIALANNREQAYPPICSVRGEVLHNESYNNCLQQGQLLLVDAGAESIGHYATDITRTSPVGGKFSTRQKEIYEVVLTMQLQAIEAIKPGIKYIDVHMLAAKHLVTGLIDLGIMKGDVEEAVHSGVHSLFFMHGLGHMLGLDVHDMEDLGTDRVGYNHDTKRSEQFGTANLRMAKRLVPGNVITVEPGIYFNPVLTDLWEKEKKFKEFINYSSLTGYRDFGGIRIEDNVAITNAGCRILGDPIPKAISEVEEAFLK